MKNIWLLLALAIILIVPASATPITYNTSGTFTCGGCTGSGTSAVVFGGGGNTASLTFTGLSGAVADTPTNASLGDITTAATGGGAAVSGAFTLTLTQTAPPPTSGSPAVFPAVFSGFIMIDGSTTTLNFSTTTASIVSAAGTTTFTLPNPVLLVPSTTNHGVTSIQSIVTFSPNQQDIPTPEPTTSMMLGGGLTGFAMLLRRFKK